VHAHNPPLTKGSIFTAPIINNDVIPNRVITSLPCCSYVNTIILLYDYVNLRTHGHINHAKESMGLIELRRELKVAFVTIIEAL
jgi:hypothetical protein